MKKRLFSILVGLSLIMFTSCLDVVQTVSKKDNSYNLSYRVSVSKSGLDMANLTTDSIKEIFEGMISVLKESASEGNQFKYDEFNTKSEYGFTTSFSVASDEQNKAFQAYLPVAKGSSITVPLNIIPLEYKSLFQQGINASNPDKETLNIINMMVSSYKYKLMLPKELTGEIKSAKLSGKGKAVALNFYPVLDSYMIEIPLDLYINPDANYNSVVITK